MIPIDSILIYGFVFVPVLFCFSVVNFLPEVLVVDKSTDGNFSHRDLIIKIKVYMFV